MRIFIRDMKGNTKSIDVNKNDTILDVKRKYGYINNVLKYEGKVLSDNKTISFYEIDDGDTIIATN